MIIRDINTNRYFFFPSELMPEIRSCKTSCKNAYPIDERFWTKDFDKALPIDKDAEDNDVHIVSNEGIIVMLLVKRKIDFYCYLTGFEKRNLIIE